MAGIYIHIPYCKQACHYCDFHFSTKTQSMDRMLDAICAELVMRTKEIEGTIETIYFGGGTPSLLRPTHIHRLLHLIAAEFHMSPSPEITLEANPDDLEGSYLAQIRQAGINRLSIGIQTFDENTLSFINRAHTSVQASACIIQAQAEGFSNISTDLIYAIPPYDPIRWENDLQKILQFSIQHISIYGLTIEKKTVFGKMYEQGKIHPVPEEEASRQYLKTGTLLKHAGFDHYEVSNYALPGYMSRHNSAYWDDVHYMGLGPGAHSYDGSTRSYNISNNPKYMDAIASGLRPCTTEKLTDVDRYNEYLFTRLRTSRGVNFELLQKHFGKNLLAQHGRMLKGWQQQGLLEVSDEGLRLTEQGFLIADELTWRLFEDDKVNPEIEP